MAPKAFRRHNRERYPELRDWQAPARLIYTDSPSGTAIDDPLQQKADYMTLFAYSRSGSSTAFCLESRT